jgi:RNA polymerase sigma-70 factor (ECF subfamily)
MRCCRPEPVLAWRAAEVADVLGMTTTAVNSALQRARAQLAAAGVREDDVTDAPGALDPAGRALVDRYVAAFQDADVGGLLEILREDATLQMPPIPTWFAGREAVARFVARACGTLHRGGVAVPVAGNTQPGVALYAPDGRGGFEAHSVQLFTTRDGRIARIDAFLGRPVFAAFDLPGSLAG